LLGPATSSEGRGVSNWKCPGCNGATFHTMPDRPPNKHRAKCWRAACTFNTPADIHDLLQFCRSELRYADRLELLADWREQWQQLGDSQADSETNGEGPEIFRPVERAEARRIAREANLDACFDALADLRAVLAERGADESQALATIRAVGDCCRKRGVSMEALALRWGLFDMDVRLTDRICRVMADDGDTQFATDYRRYVASQLPPGLADAIDPDTMTLADGIHVQACERSACERCEKIAADVERRNRRKAVQ